MYIVHREKSWSQIHNIRLRIPPFYMYYCFKTKLPTLVMFIHPNWCYSRSETFVNQNPFGKLLVWRMSEDTLGFFSLHQSFLDDRQTVVKTKGYKKFTLIIVHKTDLLGPHMRPGLAFISTALNSVLIALPYFTKVRSPPFWYCVSFCVHVVNLRSCHLRLIIGRASLYMQTHHRDIHC